MILVHSKFKNHWPRSIEPTCKKTKLFNKIFQLSNGARKSQSSDGLKLDGETLNRSWYFCFLPLMLLEVNLKYRKSGEQQTRLLV